VAGRQKIVDVLEHADDNATFERFIDLPPELRVRTYTIYFESFGVDARAVLSVPPPPCETSRLLRKESLLLFYQTRRFAINLEFNLAAQTSGRFRTKYSNPQITKSFVA
jgi:hypothetical protein